MKPSLYALPGKHKMQNFAYHISDTLASVLQRLSEILQCQKHQWDIVVEQVQVTLDEGKLIWQILSWEDFSQLHVPISSIRRSAQQCGVVLIVVTNFSVLGERPQKQEATKALN